MQYNFKKVISKTSLLSIIEVRIEPNIIYYFLAGVFVAFAPIGDVGGDPGGGPENEEKEGSM